MNLTRWRNSHGFGVHSPFGFKIAKGVVSPGNNYSYYAEPEIIALGKRDNLTALQIKHCVKLHRLVCALNIRTAYTEVKLNRCMQLAFSRADVAVKRKLVLPNSTATVITPDFAMQNLYIQEGNIPENITKEILSTPGNVLMVYSRNPITTSQVLRKHLDSGIIISGHFCSLAFSRIQTQPVCYQMDF